MSDYNLLIALTSAASIGTILCMKYIMFKKTGGENEESKTIKKEFEFKSKKEYRMILVVRNDLKMGKGKIAAQCCHAAVMAYDTAIRKRPYLLNPWMRNCQAKIAVKVDSEEELLNLEKKAKELKILAETVRDAGHTQVDPGTLTVLSLGPAPKEILDQVTGHLKLL